MSSSKNQKIAEQIMARLAQWKPYVWHHATTGSIYIKFPHWALGSIRIGDHRGRSKYSYKWGVRTDSEAKHGQFIGTMEVFTPICLNELYRRFEERAKDRHIKPGDTETWEEHIGVPTPEWKKDKYEKGALRF